MALIFFIMLAVMMIIICNDNNNLFFPCYPVINLSPIPFLVPSLPAIIIFPTPHLSSPCRTPYSPPFPFHPQNHPSPHLTNSSLFLPQGKCSSPHIPQGQVTPHKRLYLVGEVVTLRCPLGFMPHWEHKLYCGTGGVWKTSEGYTVLPRCRCECFGA